MQWRGVRSAALALAIVFGMASEVRAQNPESHESVLTDLKAAMNAAVDLVTKVEDKETAAKAVEGLKEQAKKLEELKKSAEKLTAPKAEEIAELKKKFEADFKKTADRFVNETSAIKERVAKLAVPEQQALAQALADYSNRLTELAKVIQQWISK